MCKLQRKKLRTLFLHVDIMRMFEKVGLADEDCCVLRTTECAGYDIIFNPDESYQYISSGLTKMIQLKIATAGLDNLSHVCPRLLYHYSFRTSVFVSTLLVLTENL